MARSLNGKKVALLVDNGFEQVELTGPQTALEENGAITHIVSPAPGEVKGWAEKEWGDKFPVDVPLDQADARDYDALVLPGGVMNPDKLRVNPKAVQFVRDFFAAGKPVAAICHGPWTLINAGVVEGRTMTSWPSLEADLRNAGATWVNREIVVDQGLITSRNPQDIPAFNDKIIEEIGEGVHEGQREAALAH